MSTSAGLDCIDLPECRRRGIIVTNASLAFCEDVADCAVGLLIDVLRRISAADRFVRGGLWLVKEGYPLGFKVHFSVINFLFVDLHLLVLFCIVIAIMVQVLK